MISSRLALRLAGLQVNSSLRAGNPDKAHRAACGGCAEVRERRGFFPVALRLAGLQVHRCLRTGSPDRRIAPPPGKLFSACGYSAFCHTLCGSR
ncbi:hypothetical protein ACRFV7_005374 [Klebsiella oxytoca]|uniref:hypothetical protein n=2 Tax=Klebsiella oxytoca TaxID=571 RepID=UPI001157DCA3|nr:hypothetical protein [Klebsiella oxytoca]EJA2385293.1 hypothetical protein [Klebsiella oxytoca]EJZ8301178.1 hypothetical protein [Klebsiella oxytoca]EKM0804517.1 hypothetical protein [Klebsiella oxytoca]EKT7904228.1 hypothetical protein [Klebsiella oxytoca]ELI3678368.1 hypothetical protein [Klebsiella oxytoca]